MLHMATNLDPSLTGVKDIAQVLGGGIREGSLILIEGEVKSGKSTLGQHITYGILRCSHDSSVAYYTTNDSVEELIEQMDSMSLSAGQDFVADRLRFYTVGSSDVTEEAEESLQRLVSHISELPERFKLVVVDSLTPLMMRVRRGAKVGFLQACKELSEQDRSFVLVVDTHVLEKKTLYRAYAMSDYYLRLRSKDMIIGTGQLDHRAIKILDITKLAGVERSGQESIEFEIKPKVGIQMLPFFKVKV